MVVKLTKYGNMNVMLRRGAFMPKEADDPGEVYYIQTPESIQIAPHESYIIDTGIYVNLPDGCEGNLIPRSELGICTVIDKTYVGRVDSTGNESIRVSMHGGNTGKYVYKGDVIGKLVIKPIRPFMYHYTQKNDNDMTKVNRIEIRKASQSDRQYLILYAKSKGTEYDETVILGDDCYPAKISRDIVESLELVDTMYTNLFFESEF